MKLIKIQTDTVSGAWAHHLNEYTKQIILYPSSWPYPRELISEIYNE